MYSILKSQKRCLIHQKKVSVTSSIFLTNSYIFLSFSDCSCAIYFLNLSSQSNSKTEQKQKIWKGFTSSPVLQAKRLMEGTCVLICKNYTNIYVIEMWEVLQQHRMEVEMKSIEKSQFVDVMASQADHGLLNTLGCQTRLHAYTSGCFTIQHYVYEDRKLILDCYKYKKGKTPHKGQWELFLIQIDVEINGHFVIQSINWHTGQIAIYKQSELNDAVWSLRVFSPFCQPQPQYQVQNPHGPPIFDRQVKITLPQNKFDEDTNIIQICQYIDGAYLIIVNSKSTGKMRGIALDGLTQNITGNVPQTMFNFTQIPESKLQFLGENFTKIVYGNPKDDLYITQTHQHQTIDGQLYFNGLMISNMRTGNPIQKGYCTLRNIDFSPNYRYILDVPYEYDKICGKQTLFHVRLLLSKASLYMFLMEGWKGVENIGPSFKNLIIQLL